MKTYILTIGVLLLMTSSCSRGANLDFSGTVDAVKGKICWDDGTPAAGIQVSDGFTITRTGADGSYRIDKRNVYAQWVYYTIPADAAVEVNDEGMPCFYKALDVNTQEYDFTLKKSGVENRFRILALGDPQVREANNGIYRFNNETAPDIREWVASKGGDMPTYAVSLGDLVHNEWNLYPEVKKMLSKENLSVPCFQVIGNHDHEFLSSDPIPDLRSQRKYEAAMGPVNYSFERGNVHFLILDNIVHEGKTESSCTEEICERVMQWVREDLAAVPEDKTVVVFMHAQLEYGSAPELYELLSGFKEARVICGHLHYLNNLVENVNGKIIRNDDVCTTNGVDWCAQVAGGGEPMGYASYEFENGTVTNHIYKSTGKPADYQIRLYRPSDFPPFEYSVQGNAPRTYKFGVEGDGMIVANIWNATDQWKFEVYEDGVKTSDALENLKMYDAWSCWYFYMVLGRNTYSYSRQSRHMFWYELKNSNVSSIRVTAEDEYGNKFEQTVFTTRDESDYPKY
ncbi:MAG: calcineurin-like phosphoesterase C-terminal domain-containing protein [Candidatus Cryptobacteroides sp.]